MVCERPLCHSDPAGKCNLCSCLAAGRLEAVTSDRPLFPQSSCKTLCRAALSQERSGTRIRRFTGEVSYLSLCPCTDRTADSSPPAVSRPSHPLQRYALVRGGQGVGAANCLRFLASAETGFMTI